MYSPQIAKAGIPWGKVTLVFCDIEGSGDLSRLYGRRFEPARDEYFQILREYLLRHHGFEIDNAGDSIFIAFQNATDAVLFGLEVQRIFAVHRWANGVKDLRVRIGVHTGRPIIRKDRERFTYRGTVTNLTNRVSASCEAGAVAVSEETRQAAASLEPRVVFIARETPPLKTFGDVITYEARSTEEAPPTSASTSLKSEVRRRFASMLRPETNYTAPDQEKETDQLEGARGSQYVPPADSRSSAADAGLDDRAWFEEDTDDDSDIVDFATPREIPMTDLESRSPAGTITSAELSDLNSPGDVDIEELDEDDLEDALPPDARLDPLEP
jgi:class 3 adenylate cyclase